MSEPTHDHSNYGEKSQSDNWLTTDRYLRNQIGIPESTRVDLRALPDPPLGEKPQQPLPILVKLAIHGSEKGMLRLEEICEALEERFDVLTRSDDWKRSVKNNLELNQVFREVEGGYWVVDISKGEGYKRERTTDRGGGAAPSGATTNSGASGTTEFQFVQAEIDDDETDEDEESDDSDNGMEQVA